MVWIINDTCNKVQQVRLGGPEMMTARNVYETQEQAIAAHQAECKHGTVLANSKTRHATCADCLKYMGMA